MYKGCTLKNGRKVTRCQSPSKEWVEGYMAAFMFWSVLAQGSEVVIDKA